MNLSKLLLMLPPALLLASGLTMLAVTRHVSGVGSHAGLPDWMPVASGLIFALPAVYVGAATLRRLVMRGDQPLELVSIQVWMGIVLMMLGTVIEAALATRINVEATYNSLLDENGDPNTTPVAFMAITITGTVFVGAWVSAGSYMFTNGLSSARGQYSRSLDEPDYMDEYLNYRSRRP